MKSFTVLMVSAFVSLGSTIDIKNVCDTLPSYTLKLGEHCWYDPNLRRKTGDIILSYNYTLEEYYVTTEDGYILSMQRIPHNKESKTIGQPIFLQHGAVSSSEIFVATGKKSLAFILSDMGYDVWLGNSRGNYNSPYHVTLKTTDKEFWDYTLDDMGKFDLPACIDKIVEVTQRPGDIIYLGHSQGTTIAMIYAILHNDHAAQNLKGLFLMGPVTYLDNLPVPGIKLLYTITNILYKIGISHIGIPQELNIFPTICTANSIFLTQCKRFTDVAYGPTKEYPPEQLPMLLSYIVQRESLKPLVQFTQIARSHNFSAFDYEKEKNLEVYKSEYPPLYNFKKVKLPVFLIRAEEDHLAPMHNTERLYKELKKQSQFPVKQMIARSVDGKPYNHMNFVYANNLKKTIVEPILDYLRAISGNKSK